MKKLIYVQDDFLDPKLCKPFIDLSDKSDSVLETVTHSNPNDILLLIKYLNLNLILIMEQDT